MQGASKWIARVLPVVALVCATQAAAHPAAKAKGTKPQAAVEASGMGLEGVVNINTASPEELELLPGIGPTKSRSIVAYRTKKPFKDPRHLLRVKGIGRKTLHRILPFIVVKGSTTLKKK